MTVASAEPRNPALEPDDPLAAALADPEVRASLAVIAAHASDLAVLVVMGKALLERSRDIVDNVNERVDLLRDVVDVSEVQKFVELRHALNEALPTLESLLVSPILQPEIVDVVARAGEAALEAEERTKRAPQRLRVRDLWHMFRDPMVQETIVFGLEFAQSFGRRQMLGR